MSLLPWCCIAERCQTLLLDRGEAWWTKARQWALSPEPAHLRRRGVFSSRADNACEPLDTFVWLACIQACELGPTQSAAIVALRRLQRLCGGLQCYGRSLFPTTTLSFVYSVFFWCQDPLILLRRDDSLYITCPSCSALLLRSWSAFFPITLCPPPPVRFMSLSCSPLSESRHSVSRLVSLPFVLRAK